MVMGQKPSYSPLVLTHPRIFGIAVLDFWNVHDGPNLSQIEMHKSSPPLVGCMGDLLGWWMLNRSILGIGFVDLAPFESKPSNQNQEQFVFSCFFQSVCELDLCNPF